MSGAAETLRRTWQSNFTGTLYTDNHHADRPPKADL